MSEGTKFGENKVVLTSGGPNLPEPIGLKLVPIYEAFDVNFYTVLDKHQSTRCVHSSSLLRTRRNHVQKAFREYPRLKKVIKPVGKMRMSPMLYSALLAYIYGWHKWVGNKFSNGMIAVAMSSFTC